MLSKNLSPRLISFHEDESCNHCGYQEVSLVNNYRVCTFCGTATSGPLPFPDLIQLCVEEVGEKKLADEMLVSLPSIKRWIRGKNLPRPNIEQALRRQAKKILL